MRHGAWAHFSFCSFLFEVAFGDVFPGVPAHADKYGIKGAYLSECAAETVMRLDLCGIGIEGESKSLFYELLWSIHPVDVRVGIVVSIVVADSAVKFAIDRGLFEVIKLQGQSIAEISILFA